MRALYGKRKEKILPNIDKVVARITWSGSNTGDVVHFCLRHTPGLCPFISLAKKGATLVSGILRDGNKLLVHKTGELADVPEDADFLSIEATDIMRHQSFGIHKGETVEATDTGYIRIKSPDKERSEN